MANFLETKFNVPLFVLSKNPLKKKTAYPLKSYIKNNCQLYACDCKESNQLESIRKRYKCAIAGYERQEIKQPNICKRSSWSAKDSKETFIDLRNINNLPPNRYNITKCPFAKYKGAFGAFWQPLRKQRVRQRPQRKYSVGKRKAFNYINRCDAHKNILMPDARAYKPAVRIIISNLAGCPRPLNEPGPTSYYPNTHEINYLHEKKQYEDYLNSLKPKLEIEPIPKKWKRIFYKQSMDFQPGPGHYENRFRGVCICAKGKKIVPGLELKIQKEKRNKFRGLPYTKIKRSLYCNPDWSHIKGRGFRRIFRNAPPAKVYKSKKMAESHKLLDFAKYADAKYMRLIKFPKRDIVSFRETPILPGKPKKMKFNSLLQYFVNRRNLRSKRKIGFSTNAARFKEIKPPPPITAEQLRSIVGSLPIERRITNRPSSIRKETIEGRLTHTPEHMRLKGPPRIRKVNFKFSPVPQPKLLFDEKEHRDTDIESEGFFIRDLNIADYLLKGANVTDSFLKTAQAIFKN